MGNGSGGFDASLPQITVGTRPYNIAIGDIDGDGQFDLVTANRTSGDLTLLLGQGGGKFLEAKAQRKSVWVISRAVLQQVISMATGT